MISLCRSFSPNAILLDQIAVDAQNLKFHRDGLTLGVSTVLRRCGDLQAIPQFQCLILEFGWRTSEQAREQAL